MSRLFMKLRATIAAQPDQGSRQEHLNVDGDDLLGGIPSNL